MVCSQCPGILLEMLSPKDQKQAWLPSMCTYGTLSGEAVCKGYKAIAPTAQ